MRSIELEREPEPPVPSPLLPPGEAPIPAFPREGKGKGKEASVDGAGG
jgi:hypothetical protein